ncbi:MULTISPECIES: amino acid ABC transporter permease [Snodgrassella]|uniref:Glutamate/aspartate import permease protein GltK n=1 Tax=Snodgrassella alvi SCGC AB-598-J21 TaxID=1385367 RepID=A0A074V614_9NEIS|nr:MULTISPECIES: amino acid ABC transporter permease [Snodgrassella]KEQ00863.1 ABC-type amino acid transport system, permease component [Snodgrassella alvi SCGC AB-598-J21]KES09752.1 ABC-type amino acid transport system, permease component [Snodgrassella alvi SCGC AB-598-O11]MBI0068515.1 amino acid ABC transporter permease [Snodgrassella sp. M0110]MBI0077483.1 amino acid ABC transporter permease [Snodgrassella sp. M0118]MBI0079922.1 amino acid ABC transporter permease [Snodgrassella sp. M0112]
MNYVLNMLPELWTGAKITLSLFAITLLLSIPLGLVLALLRLSGIRALDYIVNFYIWVMRGTPLMLQIFFIYFALPAVNILLPAYTTAVVAFVLNYAAYFAEIFRAGIQGVGKGQYEAAKTLGMSYGQTMRRIVLPQMWKKILPPLSNETITLVKDTSLVYVLALQDVMRVTYQLVQREFNLMPFFVAAAFYLIMTLILTWGFQKMEKRYARYDD